VIIRAKFASICPVCWLGIAVGYKISYVKGRPAEHFDCSEEGGRLRPGRTAEQAPLFNPQALAPRAGVGFGPATVGFASNLVNVTKEIRSVLVICPSGERDAWFARLKTQVTREMAIGLVGWGLREVHWTDASKGSRAEGSISICDYDNLYRLGDRQTWDLLVLDPSRVDPERAKVVENFQTRAARHLTTRL
jgi:hypothetical protein